MITRRWPYVDHATSEPFDPVPSSYHLLHRWPQIDHEGLRYSMPCSDISELYESNDTITQRMFNRQSEAHTSYGGHHSTPSCAQLTVVSYRGTRRPRFESLNYRGLTLSRGRISLTLATSHGCRRASAKGSCTITR